MPIFRSMLRSILLAIFVVSAVHSQSLQDPATTHFLAGDAAYKSGDLLTAVIEWETTLQLKPSSTYTTAQLAAAKTKWTPEFQSARNIYDGLDALIAAKKFDDAEKQIQAIQKLLHVTPKCVASKLNDLYKAKRLAEPPPAENNSRTIVMRGEPSQITPAYSENGIEVSQVIMKPSTAMANGIVTFSKIAGRIRNTGPTQYSNITIELSAIDNKTGIKQNKTYVTSIRNLAPGDIVDWIASPDAGFMDSKKFTIRVDRVVSQE